MVRRTYHQTDQAWLTSQHLGARTSHSQLPQQVQRRPKTIPWDQDCRPDPCKCRCILSTNLSITPLAFFRRSAEDILGKTDYDFFWAQDAQFYQSTDRQALERGGV